MESPFSDQTELVVKSTESELEVIEKEAVLALCKSLNCRHIVCGLAGLQCLERRVGGRAITYDPGGLEIRGGEEGVDGLVGTELSIVGGVLVGKVFEVKLLHTQEEIAEALALVARQNNMTVEQLKPYMNEDFHKAIVNSVQTGKVMALIREHAAVTEV